jgi:hypothetical protein
MIDPRYSTLQGLFADRVFRIPHYQRFYSWRRKQREDLFGDLKKLVQTAEDQHHFMATVVCHKTAEINSIGTAQYRLYDVVDGQQRLTTLILMLKCIELDLPDGSEDRLELARILVKRDGHLILLQTNNLNQHIFNRFIREGTLPAAREITNYSDQNLADAISDCQKFLAVWKQTRQSIDLMRLILHRLGFVVYDTEDGRVVYTLFEVLNSRGLAVDWLDKTKSVLMGKAYELSATPAATQAEIESLQNIWARIYGEIAKQDIPGDEILRITATLFYGPGHGKPRPADESLELLRKECKVPNSPTQISDRLLGVASKLGELYGNVQLGAVTDILQARLLAVAIMSAAGVSEDERKKLLEQWERVSFRIFGLFGRDSRAKVGDYVRIGYRIMTNDIELRTYNQVMGELHNLGREFLIETAVKDGLVGKDFYDSPDACRYLLWNYEEHLAQVSGSGATFDEHERAEIWKERASDSIEHVFPQTPGPGWEGKMHVPGQPEQPIQNNVGRIGNLILLPTVLNSEAKARPFNEKKGLYERHRLRMIGEITVKEDWGLEQIEEREKAIASWARDRWNDI